MLTKTQLKAKQAYGEKLDCTVRALAAVAEIPYQLAHKIAKASGRINGEGWYTHLVVEKAKDFDFCFQHIDFVGSIGKFAKEHPVGRFLIDRPGHAFCIVNGYIVDDQISTTPRKKVQSAWKFVEDAFDEGELDDEDL